MTLVSSHDAFHSNNPFLPRAIDSTVIVGPHIKGYNVDPLTGYLVKALANPSLIVEEIYK